MIAVIGMIYILYVFARADLCREQSIVIIDHAGHGP